MSLSGALIFMQYLAVCTLHASLYIIYMYAQKYWIIISHTHTRYTCTYYNINNNMAIEYIILCIECAHWVELTWPTEQHLFFRMIESLIEAKWPLLGYRFQSNLENSTILWRRKCLLIRSIKSDQNNTYNVLLIIDG